MCRALRVAAALLFCCAAGVSRPVWSEPCAHAPAEPPASVASLGERIRQLEAEVARLRRAIEALLRLRDVELPAPDPVAGPLVRDYLFQGDVKDGAGKGPVLTVIAGEPGPDGFRFVEAGGLHAESVGVAEEYVLELVFRMDGVNGYRKLIDFKKLSDDLGLYVYNGALVFYTLGGGGAITPGKEVRVRLERVAATREVRGFVNDQEAFRFVDGNGAAVFDGEMAYFLTDDVVTGGGEAGRGLLRRLRVWKPARPAE